MMDNKLFEIKDPAIFKCCRKILRNIRSTKRFLLNANDIGIVATFILFCEVKTSRCRCIDITIRNQSINQDVLKTYWPSIALARTNVSCVMIGRFILFMWFDWPTMFFAFGNNILGKLRLPIYIFIQSLVYLLIFRWRAWVPWLQWKAV